MEIKTIKTWVKDKNAQFIVKEFYDNEEIKSVQRLKDDAIFFRFMPIKFLKKGNFYVTDFCEDMISICYELHQFVNNDLEIEKGVCEINDIVLTNDFKFISLRNTF